MNDYVTFPHAAQVACVEREIFHISRNKTTLERVYLITSQHRTEASPAKAALRGLAAQADQVLAMLRL